MGEASSEPGLPNQTAVPAGEPAPLEYGPRQSPTGRWIQRASICLLLVGVAASAWHWWPAVNRWYALARLRQAVLNATVASNGPVITATSAERRDQWNDKEWSRRADDRLWQEANAKLHPELPRDRFGCLLFMHERVAPTGEHRLVMLDYFPMATPKWAYVQVDVRLFDPGSMLHPQLKDVTVHQVQGTRIDGTVPGWPGAMSVLAQVDWGHSFELSVGRPDPADASQFLFDYTLDGHAGQIIGKLISGDSVSFRTADGSPVPINIPKPKK